MSLISTLEIEEASNANDKVEILGYPNKELYTASNTAFKNNLLHINPLGSIANLYITFFSRSFIHAQLSDKKHVEYSKISSFLKSHNFYLHHTEDDGYAYITEYWVSEQHKCVFRVINYEWFIQREILANRHMGISAEICISNIEQHMSFNNELIDFYNSLEDYHYVDQTENQFYIIGQSNGSFRRIVTECKPKKIVDDRYDLYYGEDFPLDIIKEFFIGETDNLLLLHGDPGTGKSNFIKDMIKISERDVLYIPPAVAAGIASPGFVDFMMENKGCILLIEDGEEIISKERNSATNNLLQLTDGFLKDALDLKIVLTFNKGLDEVDTALTRKGRMHFQHRFEKLKPHEVRNLSDFLNLEISNDVKEPMSLADVFNFSKNIKGNEEQPRRMGFLP